MNRGKSLTTVFFAGVLAVLAFAPGAQASDTNIHSSAFHSDDGLSDTCFFHADNGLWRNSSTTGSCGDDTLYEVASVDFTPPSSSQAMTIYVDGSCTNAGITCTVRSFDYTGTFLGSHSMTGTNGVFDQSMLFSASEVSYWGYMQMSCSYGLAAGEQGDDCRLLGFTAIP